MFQVYRDAMKKVYTIFCLYSLMDELLSGLTYFLVQKGKS